MYERDTKFPILNLAKDEEGKFIGRFNEENLIKPFKVPVDSIFTIFKDLSTYCPEWIDCGFNCYIKKSKTENIMIQVKTKEIHKEDALEIIKHNSLKMFPEIQSNFILYSQEKLQTIDYICVIIKDREQENKYIINENGTTISLTDIKGFLKKYGYYPDIKYVPKTHLEISEELVKRSIQEKQDCNLNIYLKSATKLSDEKILIFQKKFRQKFNTFIFDKNNNEHLMYLLEYLKELSPDKSKYLLNLLEHIDSKIGHYFKEIKDILIGIIIKDTDCESRIINTNFISNEKREELIKNNLDLIKNLSYENQEKINVEILKLYINMDINNLAYININTLILSDEKYTKNIINDFLMQKRTVSNMGAMDRITKEYTIYITENTLIHSIQTCPINKIINILEKRINKTLINTVLDRFEGKRILADDLVFKQNIESIISFLNKNNYNYDIDYHELDNSDLIVTFIDTYTGEKINKKEDKNIESVNMVNKKEDDIMETNKTIEVIEEDIETMFIRETLEMERLLKEEDERKRRESEEEFKYYDNLPSIETTSESVNRFLTNYIENHNVDEKLLLPDYVPEKSITNIKISKQPNKLVYVDKELINIYGIQLTVTFNDGSKEHVSDVELKEKYADIKNPNITILYKDYELNIPITIEKKKITSLIIKEKPYKLDYIQDENINLDGMVLIANYNDLTTSVINDYEYELIDSIIHIRYANLVTTFNVNIKPKEAIGLKIIREPFKINYYDNEQINLDGLQVQIVYNNNKRENLLDYTTNINNGRVTVSYKNLTTSFSLNIVPLEVTKLELVTNPYKTSYFKGDTFDPDGLILCAYFNNNTSINLTDIDHRPVIYTNHVKIPYKNKSLDIPITLLTKQLEGITMLKEPNKIKYIKNETFDPAGLIIAEKYNDGSTIEITKYDYLPKSALTPNDKIVTIYYNDFTLEIPIEVAMKTFKSKKEKPKKIPAKKEVKKENLTEINEIKEDKKKNLFSKTPDEQVENKVENNSNSDILEKLKNHENISTKDLKHISLDDILDNIIS